MFLLIIKIENLLIVWIRSLNLIKYLNFKKQVARFIHLQDRKVSIKVLLFEKIRVKIYKALYSPKCLLICLYKFLFIKNSNFF